MSITALDLFAGCGGLSMGLARAGIQVIAANESWQPAAATYRKNHLQTHLIVGDVTQKHIKAQIIAATVEVDILVGGPPCQAYSMAGRRDDADPRGRLFEDYLAIVAALRPKMLMMENVKGLISMRHGKARVLDTIVRRLEGQGYTVDYRVLNAADYGVPQKRERVIILGTRLADSLQFPTPTHLPTQWASVRSAIDDLSVAPENADLHHIYTRHSDAFRKKIHRTAIGTNLCASYSDAYYRCPPELPSRTVKENHGSVFLHYSQDRTMTPRELARLQGFSDDFLFIGTASDVRKQIGNAVPVGLAAAIGTALVRQLIN